MDKFQIVDKSYKLSCLNTKRVYLIKIELLSYYENPIKDMTLIAVRDIVGTINVNHQQLTRRTCSLNFLNYDKNITDFINYGDKFALSVGLVVGNDVYWFSQGVFVVQNASRNRDYFTLEGVDKGGILDGSAGLGVVDSQFIVPSGSNIRDIIKDTLAINIDSQSDLPVHSSVISRPLDPANVLIDMEYKDTYTQSEVSIDSNSPIGNLFTSWADCYSAEIFYDVNGRMNFIKDVAASLTDGYKKLPIKWEFSDSQIYEAQYSKRSDVKNTVTVYTNSSIFENVSVTVYNTEPDSQNRIDLIGIRRMDSVEIPYVGISPEEQKKYCESHGKYLINQENFGQSSITLTTIMIPHLDVGNRFVYKDDSFVIRSIEFNLDSSDMVISATQIQ